MTITRYHSGIEVSDIIDDQYVKKLYIGYSVKEAKQEFKREFKTGDKS